MSLTEFLNGRLWLYVNFTLHLRKSAQVVEVCLMTALQVDIQHISSGITHCQSKIYDVGSIWLTRAQVASTLVTHDLIPMKVCCWVETQIMNTTANTGTPILSPTDGIY